LFPLQVFLQEGHLAMQGTEAIDLVLVFTTDFNLLAFLLLRKLGKVR